MVSWLLLPNIIAGRANIEVTACGLRGRSFHSLIGIRFEIDFACPYWPKTETIFRNHDFLSF